MKIVLIRPSTTTSQNAVGQDAAPPLGVAYLAASLREAGHEVSIIDALGEALEKYTPIRGFSKAIKHGLDIEEIVDRIPAGVNLIGVSCMFSLEWPITKTLIQAIHEKYPGIPIVAGGEHITACTEFVLESTPEISFCGRGEGEALLVDLAETLEKAKPLETVGGLVFRKDGAIITNPPIPRVRGIQSISRPAWDLTPIENYLEKGVMTGIDMGRSMPLMASRGCPYQCTFCSSPQMWGTRWEARPPEDVIEEMGSYIEKYQATNFDFYDLTAIIRRDWIIQFAKLLIEKDWNITWQLPSGTRSEAIDSEVTQLLYASGCRQMNYAPESGSDDVLKLTKKKIKKDRMLESMRSAVNQDLMIKANFILGFPGETLKNVQETLGFIIQIAFTGVQEIAIFPLSPYPGSEIFNDLHQRGKIELNDAYFYSLAQYTDPGITTSYSEHFSDRTLGFLCLFGMAIFFGLSFLLYPKRLVRLIVNIIKKNPTTKLETSLLRVMEKKSMRDQEFVRTP
jgi:anaerobic magnesium-protoporphyrin IX monomethyl ester cyclase